MSRATMLPVDGEELERLIFRKGMGTNLACKKMGYSATTISTIKKRGTASKHFVIAVEQVLGIEYEEYRPKKKIVPTPTIPNQVNLNVSLGELYDTIYKAVRAGMTDALNAGGTV